MDKVSFQEAAEQAGVHFNTLRNWRKSSKLKTAEKILDNGRELWIVELEEVLTLSRQSRQSSLKQPDNYHVDIGEANPANDRSGTSTIPPNDAQPVPGLATTPALEQTLVFMRESVVRPLVEANERQAAKLEQLSRENGELSVKLATVEERLRALEAAQTPPQPAPTTIPPATVVFTPKAVEPPQTAQEPPRRGWWSRLFGV